MRPGGNASTAVSGTSGRSCCSRPRSKRSSRSRGGAVPGGGPAGIRSPCPRLPGGPAGWPRAGAAQEAGAIVGFPGGQQQAATGQPYGRRGPLSRLHCKAPEACSRALWTAPPCQDSSPCRFSGAAPGRGQLSGSSSSSRRSQRVTSNRVPWKRAAIGASPSCLAVPGACPGGVRAAGAGAPACGGDRRGVRVGAAGFPGASPFRCLEVEEAAVLHDQLQREAG